MFDCEQYPTDKEAKEEIVAIGEQMFQHGYVVTNDGNITVKVSPTELWVTPTGVSKGSMTPSMMVKLDLDGNILEGKYKPSSEVKMHLRVFKENPEVRGVVHAHPVYATSFACAGVALDTPILMEAVMQVGTVPLVHYTKPGTFQVPDGIAPYCKDYNAVLLANHGVLTWGKSALQAYHRMEVVETYAHITLNTMLLNKQWKFSKKQICDLDECRQKAGFHTGKLPLGADQEENMTDVLPTTTNG
jgi:L-fuculose-phosphate aldolase